MYSYSVLTVAKSLAQAKSCCRILHEKFAGLHGPLEKAVSQHNGPACKQQCCMDLGQINRTGLKASVDIRVSRGLCY